MNHNECSFKTGGPEAQTEKSFAYLNFYDNET